MLVVRRCEGECWDMQNGALKRQGCVGDVGEGRWLQSMMSLGGEALERGGWLGRVYGSSRCI